MTTTLETFESGATRNAVDYRYDLMSRDVTLLLLPKHSPACALVKTLFAYVDGRMSEGDVVAAELGRLLGMSKVETAHLYAQAMHEGAAKYGERNWEKGIPESNLLNHALHHLFQFVAGDTSEDHQSHLVWNVLTLIHFRLNRVKEEKQ